MRGDFAAVRVRVADGPALRPGRHLPGAEVWLVCERRSNERKFHVTNHPAEAPLVELVAAIKARWVCEQGHQQMKEELGLDHCECRNWHALHHHVLLTMIAFCFLQHLRLREKKGVSSRPKPNRRPLRRCPRSGNAWCRCSSPSPDPVHTVNARFTTRLSCEQIRPNQSYPIDNLGK